MGERTDGGVHHNSAMVKNLLEFGQCFVGPVRRKISNSPKINWIEISCRNALSTEFVRSDRLKGFDYL